MAEPTSECPPVAPRLSAAAAVVIAAIAVVFCRIAGPVVAPLLAALLLSYALEPFTAVLVRWRLHRVAAAALVYTGVAIAGTAVGRLMFGNFETFVADVSGAIAYAVGTLQLTDYAGGMAAGVGARSWQIMAVALLSLLLVATGDTFKRKLMTVCGSTFAAKRVTFEVIRGIDRQIERYLIARLAISAIVAVATGMSLWLVGLEHAAVWGVVAGVLNVLPFVGPTLAVALIALAGFLQFHTIQMAAVAGGVATAVAALEGNLITPWLTSRAGELNVVAVFVSVLFWGWMWGAWGLLLAVPLTAAVKAAADHLEPLRPVRELLGE